MKQGSSFFVSADGTRFFTCEVSCEEAGQCLIDWLCARFPSYLRSDWIAAIAEGALTVGDALTTPDTVVVPGMQVACYVKPETEPVVDDTYTLCYEDAHLAVVNKSGNLPSHPAGRYVEHTLTRLLVARNGFPAAFAVNRLDRETSGLLLIAKTQEAASRAGKQVMGGRLERSYLVLVEGIWDRSLLEDPYLARGFIRLERGQIIRKRRVFTEGQLGLGGQEAETVFTCLSRGHELSLLTARPVTGRPHQIRATLKALGYPVVGDKLYGIDEMIYARMSEGAMTAQDHARLRLPHQALHAWKLAFRHPFSGEALVFETTLPAWARNVACGDAFEGV